MKWQINKTQTGYQKIAVEEVEFRNHENGSHYSMIRVFSIFGAENIITKADVRAAEEFFSQPAEPSDTDIGEGATEVK